MTTPKLVFPALATLLLAGAVPAVAGDATAAEPLQLAQSNDIEVYYDEFGRRIIRDAQTGQVLAVERPRRTLDRQATGGVRRYQEPRDRAYNMDDPADVARLRRDRRVMPLTDEDFPDEYRDAPVEEAELFAEPEVFRSREPRYSERQPIYREALPQARERAPVLPAKPSEAPTISSKSDVKVAKLQIILDRAGASPGVIDGHMGDNVTKALAAYDELTGENLDRTNEAELDAALAASGGEAFGEYTVTAEDAAGPYVASVPADYSEKAQLERLSFTSTLEMLGERFHMSEAYLTQLNPGANFNRAGTVIKVARIGSNITKQVSRIVADKDRKQVRAYDEVGSLVAAYPATIGSSDTPSPSGTVTVERIAFNPEYTYNPKINFQQGANDKVLRIPPGPNGPVGSIWIALSKPTYGIHGTPDPSKIGKTNSHGCVRLTNWDAAELAKIVKKGVTVHFTE